MEHIVVTVVGIAHKGKGGALLLTKDNGLYYMDEIDSWEENIIGKKVKVTGILKVNTVKEKDLKNKYGEWKQGVAGDKKIIQINNWEVIK